MKAGEDKAAGKRPLGPPSVRIIGPEDAAQLFGRGGPARPLREPGPDRRGRSSEARALAIDLNRGPRKRRLLSMGRSNRALGAAAALLLFAFAPACAPAVRQAAPAPATVRSPARAFAAAEILLAGKGRPPLVVAHHCGGIGGTPPNSLAGIDAAARAGVHVAEIDVRLSPDGVLYLEHDGRLAGLDARALAAVRLANGEPVPTLDAALARARGAIHLELHAKEEAALGPAIAAVRAGGAEREAIFFLNDRALRAGFRREGAGLQAIFRIFPRDDLGAILRDDGRPAALQLDLDAPPEQVEAARATGLPLLAKVGFAGGGPRAEPQVLEGALAQGFLLFETDEPERLRDTLAALPFCRE